GLLSSSEANPTQLNLNPSDGNLWDQLRCLEGWTVSLRSPAPQDSELAIPQAILECPDARKVFWWFWRCYAPTSPQASEPKSLDNSPPISGWRPPSITAALAGATAGYYTHGKDYFKEGQKAGQPLQASCPHAAVFMFTPLQALIQTSRTLEDVWAGGWLIHYLAAKICWKIAWKYGPDTLLYPCLFDQPLIDYWLLQQYPEFDQWIVRPSDQAQRLAKFPDHLVMILPDNGADPKATKGNPVWSTMIYAEQVLRQEWLALGQQVLALLQQQNLKWQAIHPQLWEGWLEAQWQSYWVALPIEVSNFIGENNSPHSYVDQVDQQVRSGWATILDQAVLSLKAVKQAQAWRLPTVFHLRSTLSGIGPVVCSMGDPENLAGETESQTHEFWQNQSSLFDGTEELNATEVVRRALHQVLPDMLGWKPHQRLGDSWKMHASSEWRVLMAGAGDGIAAWLKEIKPLALKDYEDLCRGLLDFSNHLVPYLVEQRYTGKLLYARGDDVLIATHLREWENLLWDLYQSLKGADDPEIERLQSHPQTSQSLNQYFKREGGYWHWQGDGTTLPQRPLLTWGHRATPSFGLVIAHHSVPLPIALETLEAAKIAASHHQSPDGSRKDAVQVCVLQGNGDILTAIAKFDVFNAWRSLLDPLPGVQPVLFEQAAQVWERHPAPSLAAIEVWVTAFCSRRNFFKNHKQTRPIFQTLLTQFLRQLWQTAQPEDGEGQVQNWLHLAAWILRNRYTRSDSNLLMGRGICPKARKVLSQKLS
ncbi:MAG TPA: type III-B CRISPR-associated protein Cas10/Cmr2, partial [Coleofasciculaceae cyanobacterium]